MTVLVDTGVCSALFDRRRRAYLERYVTRVIGHQILLTVQTVAELRYGALLGGWGATRSANLEVAIGAASVVPVDDQLVTRVAKLRLACRTVGHPLADSAHANDLWIAATAVELQIPLVSADRIFENAPGLDLAA